ncbi:MAG: RHS repeat-associated core domain-containing protein, partial [Faecalibacillus sp.]
YYNPEDARFITQDTYRGEKDKPETLHLYVYCANNPINYVDPSGHNPAVIILPWALGLAKAALAALITVVIGGATYVLVSQIQERARNKKPGYYMAAIRYSIRLGRNDLFVGPKIKEGYAKMRLRNKKDVWSTSKDKAMKIARKAGYGNTPRGYDKKHNYLGELHGNGKPGYYRHFHPDHPSITKPGHSFYYRTY